MLHSRPVLLLLAAAAVAFAAEPVEPATPLPKESPFKSRGAGGPAVAANETLEFAGVSSVTGKKPDLIFHDKTAKKNYWIAEGETKEGISVLKYDQRRETVLVKVNGAEKTLALRKGTGSVNAATPAPVPPMATGFNTPPAPAPVVADNAANNATAAVASSAPPPAPAAPATPETQAKAETEARMLVSDLLEIGMAQRKAYEDAQKRAATGNATPPPAQNDAAQPSPDDPSRSARPNGP